MLAWSVGTLDMLLQIVLVTRSAVNGSFVKYPLFFFPLVSSLIGTVTLLVVFRIDLPAYAQWYWCAEFVTLALCCGSCPEILRHGCAHNRATRRFALAVNASLAVSICLFMAIFLTGAGDWSRSKYFYALERDFRGAEALIYAAMVAGILYFGIPLGRNLKSILLGYGLYIGSSLLLLSMTVQFPHYFGRGWNPVPALCYGASLVIYLVGLWNYDPPPQPEHATELAARVREALNSYIEYCKARLRLRPAVQ